jgi:2-oxoglutarate dehydrogenase complex dehydrogenase (E1) component-like enzyme
VRLCSSGCACGHDQLAAEVAQYPNAQTIKWVQEEPQNMGAWTFVEVRAPLAHCQEHRDIVWQRESRAMRAISGAISTSHDLCMQTHTQDHDLVHVC